MDCCCVTVPANRFLRSGRAVEVVGRLVRTNGPSVAEFLVSRGPRYNFGRLVRPIRRKCNAFVVVSSPFIYSRVSLSHILLPSFG